MVKVGDNMDLLAVSVPVSVMIPVTVDAVIFLTACLTVIQTPAVPEGTLIVIKLRVLPLMLRVILTVVAADAER